MGHLLPVPNPLPIPISIAVPLLLLFLGDASPVSARSDDQTACGSLEINEIAELRKLQNCTHVVGHVRLAYVDLTDVSGNYSTDSLASNVTEISDYLMVYRCTGLISLQSIFPRLRIIRGQELLFDQYSLVVYENRNLRELGLVELLRIQSGFIRVESNPLLCFVETVDWMYLMGNATRQHFSLKHNRPQSQCPLCGSLSADFEFIRNSSERCWNVNTTQLRPQPPRLKDCPIACGLNGCDSAGKCCDHNCVTGCYSQNCSLCANYQGRMGCVNQCVASYEINKRRCISHRECRELGRIPLIRGYQCVKKCPGNQKEILDAKGIIHCQVECNGDFHVKSAADLEVLQDCVTINGSLTIELTNIKEKIVDALENALASVKEITGYLKVIHSAQLMSLTFLQNLDAIRGDKLVENKYALYVVNNYHLEHIWPPNHLVIIQRGTLFFHLNPRLCYEKIHQLQGSLKSGENISVADVSPNSNGERVICGDAVRSLNPKVEDLNSTAVRIILDYMDWEGMETLIGYSYHYKEAPVQNVTMYDGRHGCGHDNWLMDVVPNQSRRHVISGLKPYTQYAYFVKTLTRTEYHIQIDAYSKIGYFQTLPDRPSPVLRIYGNSEISSQILLHWWPPNRPNGVIKNYFVTAENINITQEANVKNYANVELENAKDIDCECAGVLPYYSGPQPDDEDYYNKEQITYEDALPNLIYVSRNHDYRRKEFEKVINYEHLLSIRKDDEPTRPPTTTPAPTNATLAKERLAAINYENYRLNSEKKQRDLQDLDQQKYTIRHALPKCQNSHASVVQQVEEKCMAEEPLSGYELPGNQHFYRLSQLEPETHYRITIRACVEGVVNGCSTPAEAVIKTASIQLERFIKGV
ncbi:insulin-like growth factor 1 receptor [Drosophila sechellia]|uniref:GM24195 n=1 Tax=Drosophila sechellia TaxID=7238 RepID=B4HE31_DROSE|nr:insulin-like growth factor 1 receptor [Drosophila sechellia]EDW42123.1 GM24195 [Drosophila sechellia]